MKKHILLLGIIGATSFANEYLGLPSPTLESGYTGISVSSNYKIINSKKSKVDMAKDIYRITNNNNEVIFNNVPDEILNNYFLNINLGNLHSKTINSPNTSLLMGYSLDDNNTLGLGFSYNNIKGKYDGIKTKGNGYQLSLFHKLQIENSESLTTVLYAGTLDEKLKRTNEKLNNDYWGIHTRYEFLEESYNLLFKGYRIDIEGKQLKQKYKSKKNTNDSINASLKGILKKEIQFANHSIGLEVLGGYKREFMDTRIYKQVMKDDLKDSISIETKANYKLAEKLDTYVSIEVKKSLNTSNKEVIGNIGLTYKF